jgi:hypothetical protein
MVLLETSSSMDAPSKQPTSTVDEQSWNAGQKYNKDSQKIVSTKEWCFLRHHLPWMRLQSSPRALLMNSHGMQDKNTIRTHRK